LFPLQFVVHRQTSAGGLYGPAYYSRTIAYKIAMMKKVKRDVVVIGTSRTLSFRREFFNDNVSFYNCGQCTRSVKELRLFLRKIPHDQDPKLLLLGLDQPFFSEVWDDLNAEGDEKSFTQGVNPLEIIENSLLIIRRDLAKDKFGDLQRMKDQFLVNFGVTAQVQGDGFRPDGSYREHRALKAGGVTTPGHDDYDFGKTKLRVFRGDHYFIPAEQINEAAVEELKLFLAECKDRGIDVITYLPPFAHAIYKIMADNQPRFPYIFKLHDRLAPIFASYGFEFYDFSDLASVGASDIETYDGFHASESAHARMLLTMGLRKSRIREYTDLARLLAILEQMKNPWDVLDTSVTWTGPQGLK
jgi:hypothetical protein